MDIGIIDKIILPKIIKKMLREKSYIKISNDISASSSIVFESKVCNKPIIKITHISNTCWSSFVMDNINSNNNHLPFIFNFEYHEHLFITYMEKLVPFHKSPNNEHKIGFLCYMVEKLKELYNEEYIPEWKMLIPNIQTKEIGLKYKSNNPKIDMTIESLKKYKSRICGFDLHPENIMYRYSDGRYVFCDPISQ